MSTTDIVDDVAEAIHDANGDMVWSDCVRAASAAVAALKLENERHWGPLSVPDFNDDGSPVMDERIIGQQVQRHHFEWVTRERWVTPWLEVGQRESSEQLANRLT